MLKKKRKFIIAGVIVFLAIGYLGLVGYQNSKAFDYTVSQLRKQGNSVNSQAVRVSGQVIPGSIEQKSGDLTLKFTIAEGGQNLPVVYRGVVPDTFKAGVEIIIIGSLDAGGTFQAKTLMPKCPSRYVPIGKASLTKENNSWQI